MKLRVHFTRPRGFNPISNLIRFTTGVNYSHVVLELNGIVWESGLHGVKGHAIEKFRKKNLLVDTVEININSDQYSDLRLRIDKWKDTEYGFLSLIIGLPLYMLFKIKVFNDGPKTFVCSEFAAAVLDDIIVDYGSRFDYLTPEDVRSAL